MYLPTVQLCHLNNSTNFLTYRNLASLTPLFHIMFHCFILNLALLNAIIKFQTMVSQIVLDICTVFCLEFTYDLYLFWNCTFVNFWLPSFFVINNAYLISLIIFQYFLCIKIALNLFINYLSHNFKFMEDLVHFP